MSDRVLVALFDHPDDLVRAIGSVREEGLAIADVYSPYAVHGLDEALGWRPSRLPWVGFAGAFAGLSLILWFQFWTGTTNWPLNVGGRPFASLPAYVPVAFEMFVLGGAFTAVAALLVLGGLYPGRRRLPPLGRATDDRFLLVLRETDAGFDAAAVRRLLAACRPVAVEEWLTERGRPVLAEPLPDDAPGVRP